MFTGLAEKACVAFGLVFILTLQACQVSCASISLPERPDSWQFEYSSGSKALKEKRYEKAHEVLLRALDLADGNEEQLLTTLEVLDSLYEEVGDYDSQARVLQGRLLLLRNSRNSDSSQIAVTLIKLAGLCSDCGDYFEARQYYTAAMPILRRVSGPNSFEVAALLNNMGWVDYKLNALSDAKSNFLLSLRLLKNTVGDDSILYALTAANLAELYVSTDEFYSAILWLSKAKCIVEHRLGANHQVTKAMEKRLNRMEKDALKILKPKAPGTKKRRDGSLPGLPPDYPAAVPNMYLGDGIT